MDHVSPEELQKRLAEARKLVEIGGKYYHYKNPDKFYTVMNVAIIEATEEPAVIYKPDYEGYEGIQWIRPLSEFISENEINGQKVRKFTLVPEE